LRESREPSPTIEQLAREVHISRSHFIRQFEAVFGVTPHQFRIASCISATDSPIQSYRRDWFAASSSHERCRIVMPA
jgi:AraC-like DNA-binding protein